MQIGRGSKFEWRLVNPNPNPSPNLNPSPSPSPTPCPTPKPGTFLPVTFSTTLTISSTVYGLPLPTW